MERLAVPANISPIFFFLARAIDFVVLNLL